MKKVWSSGAIVLILCHFMSAVSTVGSQGITGAVLLRQEKPIKTAFQVVGYQTGEADGLSSYTIGRKVLTMVSADYFAIAKSGAVSNELPKTFLDASQVHSLPVFACVSNYGRTGFDSAIAHSVLSNPAAAIKAVNELTTLVAGGKFAGVNLDFENVAASDRRAMTKFTGILAGALHDAGGLFMVSVPAKKEDDASDSWSGAYDYAALAGNADFIQIMAYDQNGSWDTRPGPVAGLDWVSACMDFALSRVPAAKLLLGLAAYGYDWKLGTRNSAANVRIQWKDVLYLIEAKKAVPRRDSASGSPSFVYQADDGSNHEVWFEDALSIALKTRLAMELGLGGVSVWALGFEDESFWDALSAGMQKR